MDQVTFVGDSFFKFFKDYHPKILLSSFLNTWAYIYKIEILTISMGGVSTKLKYSRFQGGRGGLNPSCKYQNVKKAMEGTYSNE